MNPSTRTSSIGWSSDRRVWDELEKVGKGLSWKKIDFDRKQSELLPGDGRGVYLICGKPPGNVIRIIEAYTILYAGQVKSAHRSLRTRFLEHLRKPNPKLRLFLECCYPNIDFWFTVTNDETQINEMEVLLQETFNPPCNSIRAPGTQPLLARLGPGRALRANNESKPD